MTGTPIETHPPTYSWTTAAGAASSIVGLVVMAVCIYASVSQRTAAGFAPIPAGVSALSCAMTLGGLVLILFRILHADREEMMHRLETMDEKLNNVWGIAAKSSIEAKPAREQRRAPRQRKRRRGTDATDANDGNVIPLRARGAADALRRLKQIVDPTDE